jgi:hypothetical protein
VLTSKTSTRGGRSRGSLSGIAAIAGRLAFIAAVVAVIVTAIVMFSPVTSGGVACGKLAEYPTGQYVAKELPLPPWLSECGPVLNNQASAADLAQSYAGILLVVGLVLSLSSKLLRSLERAVSAARRQRRIARIRPGNDIRVALPGDKHHRHVGRVVQTLCNTDEFDVSVSFDESAAEVYAYKYNELRPVLVRG